VNANDALLIAVLTVLGALIGIATKWRVSTLAYRHDDEKDLPLPGARWWIPIAAAAASGLLAWRFGLARWPLLLPTLPVAWYGPWLSAIDLDVRRLPNRLLGIHAALVAAGVVTAAAITTNPALALRAAAGGAIAFAVFWTLDHVLPGGFGWGDGKYVPIIGTGAAALTLTVEWWTFLIACLAAVAATPFRRQRSAFAFGPWLFTGAVASMALIG
jgi:leader peptidase (prepilin peptidase) / N-methyltransferase